MNADPLATIAWPIRTERLLIRRATADDVDETWRWRKLPEVAEWLGSVTTTYESYRERFLDADRMASIQVIELDGVLIGDFMIRIDDAWSQDKDALEAKAVQAELGWTLDPDHQGHGYATEVVRAVIEQCVTTLGLRRLTAECFYDNTASWRLMERIGMRRENHGVKDGLHPDHGWTDSLTYAILAEEWRRLGA